MESGRHATTTLCHGMSMDPMTSASTWGMPEPDVAGSQRTSAATATAAKTSPTKSMAMRSGCSPKVDTKARMVPSAQVSERR